MGKVIESTIPDIATMPIDVSIDEYLRKRLMPVEGAIPHLPGIEMCGNSIPAGKVGGDLFEYINFQQRYNIDARIERAHRLSKKYLEPLPEGARPQNGVHVHVQWLESRPGYDPADAAQYRRAKRSEQLRIAEGLQDRKRYAKPVLCGAAGGSTLMQ
jgi:hypothetical protein